MERFSVPCALLPQRMQNRYGTKWQPFFIFNIAMPMESQDLLRQLCGGLKCCILLPLVFALSWQHDDKDCRIQEGGLIPSAISRFPVFFHETGFHTQAMHGHILIIVNLISSRRIPKSSQLPLRLCGPFCGNVYM